VTKIQITFSLLFNLVKLILNLKKILFNMFNLMSYSPSNFGRYVSQTEYSMDETERIQTQQKPLINNIPSLMSLSITPPSITTTNTQQKSPIPSSVIKENIEPLPFPQHGPGPIQRPNKLSCASTTQISSFITDSPQSPSTPDVLVQISHLVDRQNSIATNVSNLTNINDISTPNVPWTPFSPSEWSTKYDSTWPMTNIQSSNISLTTQIQNPFVQRQISKEESALWSSALESAQPRNTSWLKFSSISDSSSSNRQENETNNPFWNSINLPETPQTSSTSWWPKAPSDENNNDNDQSKWDFAR
jgi:hypothetical protein